MKQFLLGLSISAAFIAGCVTATVAQSTAVPEVHAAADGVQRWEYNCPLIKKGLNRNRALDAEWAALGADGWEMISAQFACFKRPV